MLYVIGDTHGCFTELMQLMKKIEEKDNAAEYILIGDIYDRGKKSSPYVSGLSEISIILMDATR